MVGEILKGMVYIQKSILQVHGHLNSKNCMVDARFNIRIGDYDHILYEDIPIRYDSTGPTNTFYHNNREHSLLWIAPEVMTESHFNLAAFREGRQGLPRGRTKQSDIYSLGIILQELIFRNGPAFTLEQLSPEEKIQKLIMNDLVLVKNNFTSKSIGKLEHKLAKCLAKNPLSRYPDCAAALADLNLAGLKVGKSQKIIPNK